MASWNQANGTSPYSYVPNQFGEFLEGPGTSEPRFQHPSPALARPPPFHHIQYTAYMDGNGGDRPSSANVPSRPAPTLQQTANMQPAFGGATKWNPAQLLNPRGFAPASRQNLQNPFSNGNHSSPNLSFQFESPAGTPPPSYSAPTTPQPQYDSMSGGHSFEENGFSAYANGNANGQMNGMGNMLERMHNVTDRSMVPQKRRKIHDERGDNAAKAQFNGGGKGGVLGDYMRQKREEGNKEFASTGTMPVILDDDNDEIEIISDSNEKEVCYGRIEGAKINAHKVPTPKPGSISINVGFWPQIKIVLRRRVGEKTNVIHAYDGSRENVGCVDISTAIGLTPILDSRFNVRTTSRILSRRMKDGEQAGAAVSAFYDIDLNIYGPRKYALQIGRHFSQKQLWLRTPVFVEAGVELYNPHAIERPPQILARPLYNSYASRQQGPARTTEDIRNDVLGMFDSLERSEILPEMNADPRITTELLKHQKQGLYFMTNKEKPRIFGIDAKSNSSFWRLQISGSGQRSYLNVITGQEENRSPPQVLGGILADMMGLGKTLSILSLVVQTFDNEALEWAKQAPCSQDDRDLCPGRKSKGKTALPKLNQTPLVLNAKTTLLIAPLSTLHNWEEQIKQHIKPETLNVHVYHGPNRIKDLRRLAEFDLVITTYGSVSAEFGNRSKQKNGAYPLEEINWFRIVLDEAHMIREQNTNQFKGVCRLAANRRWAVTGTPVQNRLEDLGALMTFLRIKPFDERGGFAQHIMAPFKMCDPEILPKLRLLVDSITLRRLKDRIDLPERHDHLVKLDFTDEERRIYDIFAKNASDRVKVIVGQREQSLGGKSYVHILQSILRLRLICAHGKDLLGEEDLKVMDGLDKDSAIDLDSDDENDQPGLTPKQAYDMYNLMKETGADNCVTCTSKITASDVVDADGEAKDEVIGHMTPCFHILCNNCIGKYKASLAELAQGKSEVTCPICKQWVSLSYFALKVGGVEDNADGRAASKKNARQGKDLSKYSGQHSKTRALIEDLLKSRFESELMPNEPPIKSVVFSGWTAHLDLIQIALDDNDIHYVRLDGKMSRGARTAAMDTFRDDPHVTVILVSIMAGGLGLNLTTGNKVYVMEPQYNPAAEAQAVDRVHRLGQKREVHTVRYIMNDSFEEKMLELQDKKKKLAQLSMDSDGRSRMDKAEAARKRLEDLRSLFK